MTSRLALRCLCLPIVVLLAACQAQAASTSTPIPPATASPTASLTPTYTPSPTASPSPLPTATLFPLPVPTAPVGACDQRRPAAEDLWPVVTAAFGLDAHYVPPDLVKLGSFLPGSVSLPDQQLRLPAAQALEKLVKAMRADGLHPTILSAYRSYVEQVVAHNRWQVSDPSNADLVSAPPGHSEHQLGTVVDFGSPGLPALTGSTTDPFSPLFSQTDEGRWLEAHAFEYGFTMTNPPGAEPWTGLTYEPWHYRFVGVELATYLHASGYFLTEYLFKVGPAIPCLP